MKQSRCIYVFLVVILPLFSQAQLGYMGKRVFIRYDMGFCPITGLEMPTISKREFPQGNIEHRLGLDIIAGRHSSFYVYGSVHRMDVVYHNFDEPTGRNYSVPTEEEKEAHVNTLGLGVNFKISSENGLYGKYIEWGLKGTYMNINHKLGDYILERRPGVTPDLAVFGVGITAGIGLSDMLSDHFIVNYGICNEIAATPFFMSGGGVNNEMSGSTAWEYTGNVILQVKLSVAYIP